MNITQLRDALRIQKGSVTLHSSRLNSPKLQTLFSSCYGHQPIAITQASPGPRDGPDQIVIQGTAPGLTSAFMPSARAVANSFTDVGGQGQRTEKDYAVRSAAPGAGGSVVTDVIMSDHIPVLFVV